MTKDEIQQWLDMEPDDVDIVTETDAEGNSYRYLPYRVIVRYLDELTGGDWSAKQWHFQVIKTKYWYASGSIEVEVAYKGIRRVLAGAATYPFQSLYPNHHFEATLQSLAIMNAAKMLGRRFGLFLNEDVQVPKGETQDSPTVQDEEESEDDKTRRADRKLALQIKSANSWEEMATYESLLSPKYEVSTMLFAQKKKKYGQ